VGMFDELKHNQKRRNGSKQPLKMAPTNLYNKFHLLEDFEIFVFLDIFWLQNRRNFSFSVKSLFPMVKFDFRRSLSRFFLPSAK
jgi:hypothetical protein